MSSNPIVPFSEPPYLAGLPSPYYKPTHLAWQKACREFVQKNLLDSALEWDTEETIPEHVFETFAKAGMLLPSLPAPLPVEWLKRLGIHKILGVVKVEDFDYIHTMIYCDEVPCPSSFVYSPTRANICQQMARSGLAGPSGSLTTGISFGVPPILKYGNKQLQDRFLPELLTGKKRTCIG